jgi:hypothetical protein
MFRVACHQERTQVVGHREHASLPVLGCLRVEPDFAGVEVDLAPLEREHFRRDAPARDVSKLDHRPQRLWQVRENVLKHLELEETLSRVSFLEHRNVRTMKQLSGLHRDLHRALARAIEENPFIAQRLTHESLVGGIANLGNEQAAVLQALASRDFRWPLRFWRRVELDFPLNIVLEFPRDIRVLPLIASAYVSAAGAAMTGGMKAGPGAFRMTAEKSWQKIAHFSQIGSDSSNTEDERAAAILLMGVHKDGDWSRVCGAWSDLLECAKRGVSLVSAVAVVLEAEGLAQDLTARQMLGTLIEVSRSASPVFGDPRNPLDDVFGIWRERSGAPVTTANAMERWLGITEA